MPSAWVTGSWIIAWNSTRFRSSGPLIERWRAARRVVALVLALALCYPAHRWHGLVSRRPSPWIRRFLRLAARVAGLRIAVIGSPLDGPVLYVANHISWLDILLLGGTRGSAFVAKAEVKGWPVIGWLAGTGDTIFVERAARGAVQAQTAELRAALGRGRPITLFPEGTTGDGVALRDFRASLLAAVAGGPVPVQPVAIRYADPEAVFWPEGEPAGVNALRLLGRPGRLAVTLTFLAPLDPMYLDRKSLAGLSQRMIADALAA